MRRLRLRRLSRTLCAFAAIPIVMAVAGMLWAWASPPELLRVGAGYSAKTVCSSVFVAGREPEEVLAADVQAPGHPLLRLMRVRTDRARGAAHAAILGFIAPRTAVFRQGLGCTLLPDGVDDPTLPQVVVDTDGHSAVSDAPWPTGGRVDGPLREVEALLDDVALTGPGMRAVVVVRDGRIVGERYAPGFPADMPQLGWSMTKTITAAIIGTLVKDGRLSLDQRRLFGDWHVDARAGISISDLMAMSSGLAFRETYGGVSDATRMLFLEPDMAAFAAAQPLEAPVGTVFAYSSGTTLMLSRLWQEAVGPDAMNWPARRLFGPLGMHSAVLEPDASGTFVGSSNLYATPRDWARFGQLLLQEGVWKGEDLLPPGFVKWMREPAPASNGSYGRGQLWLHGLSSSVEKDIMLGIPEGTYWLSGHDGQSMAIVPSLNMVVLRMGLTPTSTGHRPQPLVAAVSKLFREAATLHQD